MPSRERLEVAQPASQSWQMDRRVPVAIIITLMFQTLGAVWWAATLQSTVASNIKADNVQDLAIQALDAKISAAENKNYDIGLRFAELKSSVEAMSKNLDRQVSAMDRLTGLLQVPVATQQTVK